MLHQATSVSAHSQKLKSVVNEPPDLPALVGINEGQLDAHHSEAFRALSSRPLVLHQRRPPALMQRRPYLPFLMSVFALIGLISRLLQRSRSVIYCRWCLPLCAFVCRRSVISSAFSAARICRRFAATAAHCDGCPGFSIRGFFEARQGLRAKTGTAGCLCLQAAQSYLFMFSPPEEMK